MPDFDEPITENGKFVPHQSLNFHSFAIYKNSVIDSNVILAIGFGRFSFILAKRLIFNWA